MIQARWAHSTFTIFFLEQFALSGFDIFFINKHCLRTQFNSIIIISSSKLYLQSLNISQLLIKQSNACV